MTCLNMNRHLNSFSLRQRWLVVLVVIAVLVSSPRVFAFAESPSAPLLHDSVESLSKTPVEEHADLEIVAPTRNDTIPKLEVASSTNECSCPTAESSRIDELTIQLESFRQEHDSVAVCQKELADVIANRNDSIQATKSLNEKIERMEKRYLQVVNETNTELNTLEETAERQKHQLKTKEDRYQDTRRKLLEVDAELREMHKSAVSKYVNFTLMKEDAWNGVERTCSKATLRVQRRWVRYMRPRINDAKRRYNRMYREQSSYFQRKVTLFKRKTRDRWARSKTIRPLLETSQNSIMGQARKAYRRFEPVISEVEVACRLSTVSAIEEASKSAILYLEKEERTKHEARERELKKQNDPMEKRRRKLHKIRDNPNLEKKFMPSRFNLKAREFFKYSSANSKKLYEAGLSLLPLAVALSVTRCGIIGSILLFWRIPTPLIWAIVTVKFITRWKKRDSAAHAQKKNN